MRLYDCPKCGKKESCYNTETFCGKCETTYLKEEAQFRKSEQKEVAYLSTWASIVQTRAEAGKGEALVYAKSVLAPARPRERHVAVAQNKAAREAIKQLNGKRRLKYPQACVRYMTEV